MSNDNNETLICPACGEEMSKIYMDKQNLYLDVCLKGCGGIFFDNRELAKFDEHHEDITPLIEAYKGKEFKRVDESQTRACPYCGATMVKNFVSAKNEIQMDECYTCGGKFLDYGEIEKMRSEYETEIKRSQDFNSKFNETHKDIIDNINKEYEAAIVKDTVYELFFSDWLQRIFTHSRKKSKLSKATDKYMESIAENTQNND